MWKSILKWIGQALLKAAAEKATDGLAKKSKSV